MPPEIMITASAARTVSVLRIQPMPVVSATSTYRFASRLSKPGRIPMTRPPVCCAPRLTASITPESPPLTTTAPCCATEAAHRLGGRERVRWHGVVRVPRALADDRDDQRPWHELRGHAPLKDRRECRGVDVPAGG